MVFASALAFAAPLPVRAAHTASARHAVSPRRAVARPLRAARAPRACAEGPAGGEAKGSTENEAEEEAGKKKAAAGPKKGGLTKTEELAAKLGQSRESMEENAAAVYDREAKATRRRYLLAGAAAVLGLTLAVLDKRNPNSARNVQQALWAASAPVSVVGSNERPSVVEVSTSWCENCRAMAKPLFDLENEFARRVNFVCLDGDDPANARVVDALGVDGIPQFTLIDKGGKVLGNYVGIVPKEVLRKNLDAMVHDEELPFAGVDFSNPSNKL